MADATFTSSADVDPGVESQVANLFAGPFAAMMDRARDAIVFKG